MIEDPATKAPLYGVALKVWTLANDRRTHCIKSIKDKITTASRGETRQEDVSEYWIPYAFCLLSHFPLYNLLSDCLRQLWLTWTKEKGSRQSEYV